MTQMEESAARKTRKSVLVPESNSKETMHAEAEDVNADKETTVAKGRTVDSVIDRLLRHPIELLIRQTVGEFPPVHALCLSTSGARRFLPLESDNTYCKLVYSAPTGLARCNACYDAHLASALNQTEPFAYTCHAGLRNVIVPIETRGKPAGALLLGRVLLHPLSAKQKRDFLKGSETVRASATARKALAGVPVVTEANLLFASLLAKNFVRAEAPLVLEGFSLDSVRCEPTAGGSQMASADTSPFGNEQRRLLRCRRICRKVIELMESQYATPISTATLAAAVKLSPNYLSTIFHKTTGSTIVEYLRRIRLQEAMNLLRQPEVKIREAASRVGFRSVGQFVEVFKKATGLNPSDWRATSLQQGRTPERARPARNFRRRRRSKGESQRNPHPGSGTRLRAGRLGPDRPPAV